MPPTPPQTELPAAAPAGSHWYREQDTDLYPSGDGEPMAETQEHILAIMYVYDVLLALRTLRDKTDDWYVVTDNFWYYERNVPSARFAPDVMLVPDAESANRWRQSWLEWNEDGKRPSVIFEIASSGTWRDNIEAKRLSYESLGVREYFVFDPLARYLVDPPIRGWRLHGSRYRVIRADRQGRLESRELGTRMQPDGLWLRMSDTATGDRVLTESEDRLARLERTRVEREAQRVRAERAEGAAQAARARAERAEGVSEARLARAEAAEEARLVAEEAAQAAREEAFVARRREMLAERAREEAEAARATVLRQLEAMREAMIRAGVDPDLFPQS